MIYLVILMKKYLISIFLSLFIGVFFAYFIIHQYESLDGIQVSSKATELYYVQKGVYSDRKSMEEDMKVFNNYIYNVEENMYHSYIGVSNYKSNAEKLQNVYRGEGIETVIKESIVDNFEFIKILKEYDDVLSKMDDVESIKVISRQVLAKYEEYVNGKH